MIIARFLIAAVVFAFIIGAPSEDSIYQVVIVLGQAHFLMAYYYQYKAGKINQAYVLRYILASFLVFGSYSILGPSIWPGFLAGSYFVIHFLYDERYLLAESTSFQGWLRLIPIVIACLPVQFTYLDIDIYDEARYMLLVVGGGVVVSWIVNKKPVLQKDLYFLVVFVLCCILTFSEYVPNVGQAVSFIVLAHYGHWYVNYLIKFKSNPVVFKRFLLEIIIFNVSLGLLYFYYIKTSGVLSSELKYVFHGDFFSLWTIMHYFVTFRLSDLNNWIPDKLQINKGVLGLWKA